MTYKRFAIIVAGGSGTRMGAELPKQFLPLAGLPMLAHSLKKFYESGAEVIIALPEIHISTWQKMLWEYEIDISHKAVAGGQERFHSVKNALDTISDNENSIVAIHDAARPFISPKLIESIFEAAHIWESCIPVLPVKESLRRKNGEDFIALDRSEYFTVQTPQAFNLQKLKNAYKHPYKNAFTDDASVWEAAGYKVFTVEGEDENFKITTAADLEFAKFLSAQKSVKTK